VRAPKGEAARRVIRLRVSELRAEIDGLVAKAEELRGHLNGLMPTLYDRPWPVAAEALLHDPEAGIDRGEALPDEASTA
jgi:hypothetical protein